MTEAYKRGFMSKCAEYGLDRYQSSLLLKVADGYKPMYGTAHQVGSLKSNINAAKSWAAGNGPSQQAAYSALVDEGELAHDQSSISAPTLVDLVHGWWDGVKGRGNPYGNTNRGSNISVQQFDANIQNARMPNNGWQREVNPGEYDGSWTQNDDGSFSRGNTRSYPIDGNVIAAQFGG